MKQLSYKKIIFSIIIVTVLMGLIFWLSKSDIFLLKQREFNKTLMMTIRELRTELKVSTLIYLSFLSMLYGLIHAIGPGHGKLVISGFLMNNSNNYKKAIRASFFTTLTHVGMAVILAYLLKYIFTGVGHFARMNMMGHFKLASGILIGLIGLTLFFGSEIKKLLPNDGKIISNNAFLTGLLGGAIPCPLSMTIILISISYSIEYIGIILVSSIALGILSFLLIFSAGFVFFKTNSILIAQKNRFKLPFKIRYLQSLFYIAIGCFLAFA